MQDGYAVIAADGPGEYVVAFAAHAGTEQQRLEPGSVAYITTGVPSRGFLVALAPHVALYAVCTRCI